ncbi:MAG TPA: PqqD family protein [Rectinemataceae bacterium]
MLKIRKGVMVSEVDGEAVLMDQSSGKYFGLNATAYSMLKAIADSGSAEAAIASVCAEYDAPAETVRADCLALIESLKSKGILEDAV